jgi:Domain of unknown function (DUF397)
VTAVDLWVFCCRCLVQLGELPILSTGDGYLRMSTSAQGPSAWRRSSKCAATECVEIAREQGMILLRDSKSPDMPAFRYTTEEFRAFLDGAKAGEFDDLI